MLKRKMALVVAKSCSFSSRGRRRHNNTYSYNLISTFCCCCCCFYINVDRIISCEVFEDFYCAEAKNGFGCCKIV